MSSKPRRTLAGPIFRVRTGCLTCRGRKKKCDETKPRCRGCERNRLDCRWPPSASPKSAPPSAPAGETAEPRRGSSSCTSTGVDGIEPRQQETLPHTSPILPNASPAQSNESSDAASIDSSPRPPSRATAVDPNETLASQMSPENPVDFLASLDFLSFTPNAQTPGDNHDEEPESPPANMLSHLRASTSPVNQVPRTLSFLPGSDDSFSVDLLSHYLAATTISMANGSTMDNPFSEQLIPLAFSSDLVLQLLLAQSAVHRAAKSLNDLDSVANDYYNKSLRLFQRNLSKAMVGQNGEQTLLLGIAALIMCFIETARGDINGTTYDHLMAAQSLIIPSLPLINTLPKAMRQFLIEYYVYTATLSMISIDARLSDQLFLSNELALLATELVAESYVGNLCGCWLPLILLIPSIFDLGRRFKSLDNAAERRPSTDDFLLFSQLQNQIQNWTPNPAVTADVALAGLIYHKALLLYLYTALHPLCGEEHGIMAMAIQTALTEGLSHLAQLDPTVRVNTSLSWPIAVIGSCVADQGQRTFLRERLGHTFAAIGLGNIHQTSVLLQHVWEDIDAAAVKAGPWNISRVMNENQIWISFA